MTKLKKALALILIFVLVVSVAVVAADAYSFKGYTVRFYAGEQGTFAGGDGATINGGTVKNNGTVLEFTGESPDDVVRFVRTLVNVNDNAKYYVKGIRESGKDNNTVSLSAFTVTEDADYVVAYGMMNGAVSYTIHYVDQETGVTLQDDEVHYGIEGDTAYEAFPYIDGYDPVALNAVFTVTDGGEYTFYYTAIVTATPTPAPTTAANTETAAGGTGTAQNPAASAAPTATAAASGTDAGTDTAVNDTSSTAAETTETTNGTGNLITLDDGTEVPETVSLDGGTVLPEANGGEGASDEAETTSTQTLTSAVEEDDGGTGSHSILRVLAVVGAGAIVAATAYLLFFRKKKSDEKAGSDENE